MSQQIAATTPLVDPSPCQGPPASTVPGPPPSEPIRPRPSSRASNRSYKVPGFATITEEVEPVPEFEDAAKSLITKRLNLIEELCHKQPKLKEKDREQCLASVVSRVAASGHLNEHLDGTKVDVAVKNKEQEAFRAEMKTGNKRWQVRLRGRYNNPYTNAKDVQPKAILQHKVRDRCRKAFDRAFRYAEEFGYGFINKPAVQRELEEEAELSRIFVRTHPGALNVTKIFDTLKLYQKTSPDEYNAFLAIEQRHHRITHGQLGPYQGASATPSPPVDFDDRRYSTISNDSDDSFASFTSADTFGAGLKKVRSKADTVTKVIRKTKTKIPGIRRLKVPGLSKNRSRRQDSIAAESAMILGSSNEAEDEAPTMQEKYDSVNQWISGLDYETQNFEVEVIAVSSPVDPSVEAVVEPCAEISVQESLDQPPEHLDDLPSEPAVQVFAELPADSPLDHRDALPVEMEFEVPANLPWFPHVPSVVSTAPVYRSFASRFVALPTVDENQSLAIPARPEAINFSATEVATTTNTQAGRTYTPVETATHRLRASSGRKFIVDAGIESLPRPSSSNRPATSASSIFTRNPTDIAEIRKLYKTAEAWLSRTNLVEDDEMGPVPRAKTPSLVRHSMPVFPSVDSALKESKTRKRDSIRRFFR